MPIFLDRHDVGEASAEDVAKLHVKDLEIQGKYGVKFLTYWYDAERPFVLWMHQTKKPPTGSMPRPMDTWPMK